MVSVSRIAGDDLVSLLGRTADDPEVQKALKDIAHGAQPELDPEDEDKLVDWILVNELGLEFGFEDEAYVRAEDPEKRRQSPLLFTQVYFYGETARTEACPLPLPFGLALADDRNVVRSKLRAHEAVRRSYVRDAWELPDFNLIVAYSKDTGLVESVLAHIRYSPWPDRADAAATVAAFTPEFFRGLFGVRWSQERLRHDFGPLGYEAELPSVRSAHTADFRLSHGIELHFSPCRDIAGADLTFPDSPAFNGVTYYAARQLDAREWKGPMPFQLSFADSQADVIKKVGRRPDHVADDVFSGSVSWGFDDFVLTVVYSNVWNTVVRVMLRARSRASN